MREPLASQWLSLKVLLIVVLLAAPAQAGPGKKYFDQGRKAETAGDFDQALVLYERAAREEPRQAQYVMAARRMRFQAAMVHVDRGHKLRDAGKLAEAVQEFERAFAIDPGSAIAEQELRRTLPMLEAQRAGQPAVAAPRIEEKGKSPRELAEADQQRRLAEVEGPVVLTPPSRAPITLRATNDSRILFETIGKLAGINVLFDPDYSGRRITIELNNVTLEQALDHVAVLTKSLWKPLTTNTILVYSEQKRRDHEQQVVKTFYLSNVTQPAELTEVAQTLRNLLEMLKLQQVTAQNAIVVRDTPDKVAVAEKIIADIDKSRAEIVIDVAVLQVRRDRSREIGLYPGSPGLNIPVSFTPRGVTTTTGSGDQQTTTSSGPIPLTRLRRLSSGDWSVVLPGGALTLLLSDGSARLLQNPQVRASDGQSAKLRIGERIPIATGSFQPGIGGVGINPLVNTQFQYTDVGVNVDITPRVHGEREISMKIKVEVSSVTNRVNIGGIDQPVIGQRTIEEDLRLREGEMNVLGGIIENQVTNSLSGIPGLSQIPLLKYLFSSTRTELAENEVLIVMTPHIVRLPQITALNLRGIDVGTATNVQVRTRPMVEAPPLPAGGGVAPVGGTVAPATPAAPPVTTPPPAGVTPPATTPPESPAGPRPAAPGAATPIPGATPTAPGTTTPDSAAPGAAPGPTPPPAAKAETEPEEPEEMVPSYASLHYGEGSYTVPFGNVFNVDIQVQDAKNIASVPFQLHFDPKLLKLVNIVDGSFLKRDGQTVAIVQNVDNEKGTATITLTRPPGTRGMSGQGVLATVSFQATGRGQGALNILRVAARDPASRLVEIRGARVPVTVK